MYKAVCWFLLCEIPHARSTSVFRTLTCNKVQGPSLTNQWRGGFFGAFVEPGMKPVLLYEKIASRNAVDMFRHTKKLASALYSKHTI